MKCLIEYNNAIYGTTYKEYSVSISIVGVDALLSAGFETVDRIEVTFDHEIACKSYFVDDEVEQQLVDAAVEVFESVKFMRDQFEMMCKFLQVAEQAGVSALKTARWLVGIVDEAEREINLFS